MHSQLGRILKEISPLYATSDRHKECMSTLYGGVIYFGAPDPVTVFALDLWIIDMFWDPGIFDALSMD